MFEAIKSKLGFQSDNDYYDDEFDGEYDAYSDNYDDYSTYDDDEEQGYSPYSPVTTRDPGVRPLRSTYAERSSYSQRRRPSQHPPLVSYDEVRASTSVPDSLSRDPLPPRRTSIAPRSSAGRASDYSYSGTLDAEGYDEPYAAQRQPARQSGYDSLFSPTTGQAASSIAQASSEVGVKVQAPAGSQSTTTASYDPYRAYEGTGSASHRPTRNVVVLSPVSYDEVADVARTLKAGDAVVLSLRNTNSQLSKRILDFSFGVASALDARVDCIADKVFAIVRGDQLTDAERMRLRGQGVI